MKIHDLTFEPFLIEEEIKNRIKEIALEIAKTYQNEPFIILAVLNGAFRFVAELAQNLDKNVEFEFIRVKSYENTHSSGEIKEILGLQTALKDKNILIVEDIIDTGNTVCELLKTIKSQEPKSVKVATLLFKPFALQIPVMIDFIGFEIENKFVVGYGLDYNERGRELNDIYVLKS